jgi:hypothetical protein
MEEKERYRKGLETRREVLGKEHVDRSQTNLSEFNAGIYCGLPAANAAIQVAEQVIKETKGRSDSS